MVRNYAKWHNGVILPNTFNAKFKKLCDLLQRHLNFNKACYILLCVFRFK